MILFEPAQIGTITCKNRIVMLPMMTHLNKPDGDLSDRAIDFYTERARGGAGLIIAAMWAATREVDIARVEKPGVFLADNPKYMHQLSRLAENVHRHGAKIALQLTAGHGRVAWLEGLSNGAVAPSEQPCFYDSGVLARALTTDEIQRLVQGFGRTVRIAASAGIDAVEIHGHAGYLIDQFMTPIWNRRTDRYGGPFEDRMRFPREIIESIRAEAGNNIPVLFRMSVEHGFSGGREIAESLEIARYLESLGVNAINVNVGCYDSEKGLQYPAYNPPGGWIHYAAMVKKAVAIPVIAVGRLDYPGIPEKAVQDNKTDFIGLGRAFLADPEWPVKMKEDRSKDILPCIGCNECMRGVSTSQPISCSVNPRTGQEAKLAIVPGNENKSVLVVGGGPAGMQAARVAALRGHYVTLWEKASQLGGHLVPVSIPDFKRDTRHLLQFLSGQLETLGVNVVLEKESTLDSIRTMNPDALIIATGSSIARSRQIPGIEKQLVLTAFDVFTGKQECGKRAAVIGGSLTGCELALYLSRRGNEVTLVEAGPTVLPDEFECNRHDLLYLLHQRNISILTAARPVEITDTGLVIETEPGIKTLNVDNVILASGFRPDTGLAELLERQDIRFTPIGDCIVPRKRLKTLLWGGFYAARSI